MQNEDRSRLQPNCFLLLPQKTLINLRQHNIPNTWFKEFVDLCTNQHYEKTAFHYHVGKKSTYRLKKTLLESLQQLYLVLSKKHDAFALTEDKKQALKHKLLEGIRDCTPGFHNRVNDALEGLYEPKTIDEILVQMRRWLVDRAARQISDDVHAHNHFFYTAHQLSYGVHPINNQDAHINIGRPHDPVATKQLNFVFNNYYQPLHILLEIKKKLTVKFNYRGQDNTGYPFGDYQPGLDLVQLLLDTAVQNQENVLVMDNNYTVVNINWNYILSQLWHKLSMDYFEYSPEENSRIVLALGQSTIKQKIALCHNTQEHWIREKKSIFSSAEEVVIFMQLIDHENLTPKQTLDFIFAYLKSLKQNPSFNECVDFFWEYAATNPMLANPFRYRLIRNYKTYWQKESDRLFDGLSNNNTLGATLLKSSILSLEEKRTLFFKKTNLRGENGLVLMAKLCPTGLSSVLQLISAHESQALFSKRVDTIQVNRLGQMFPKIMTPFVEYLLFCSKDDINTLNSYPSNVLDIMFINNSTSSIIVKLLFEKLITLELLLFINQYVLFFNELHVNFSVALTASLTVLLYVSVVLSSYIENQKILNPSLLPQLSGLLFNKYISQEQQGQMFNFPPLLIQKEMKKHQGDIKLALAIMLFSTQIERSIHNTSTKSAAIALRNNLAKELTCYANSSKTDVDKKDLREKWLTYCDRAKSTKPFQRHHSYPSPELSITIFFMAISVYSIYKKNTSGFIWSLVNAGCVLYTSTTNGSFSFFSPTPATQLKALRQSIEVETTFTQENNTSRFAL